VRSAPGVATALVGMSRAAHVAENMNLAKIGVVSSEDYERLFQTT
jgi:aryl-alcohol dehydrogenase-like predicted oxidoreductase